MDLLQDLTKRRWITEVYMRENSFKCFQKGNWTQRFAERPEKQAFIKWGLQVLHRLSTAQMVGGLKGFTEERLAAGHSPRPGRREGGQSHAESIAWLTL